MCKIKNFLKSIEMFIGLSDDMLDQVAVLCQAKTFPANSIIIKRQSPPEYFYLIQDGMVEILTGTEEQDENMTSVVVALGKGQSFGEMGLVDSGARSASVRATTETELYEIDCRRFRDLCEADTDLGYQVMRNIATDLSFKLRYRNLI